MDNGAFPTPSTELNDQHTPVAPCSTSAAEKDTTRQDEGKQWQCTTNTTPRTPILRPRNSSRVVPEQQLLDPLGWLSDTAHWCFPLPRDRAMAKSHARPGTAFPPQPSTDLQPDRLHAARKRWTSTNAPPRRMAATLFLVIGDPRQSCSALIPPTGRSELV